MAIHYQSHSNRQMLVNCVVLLAMALDRKVSLVILSVTISFGCVLSAGCETPDCDLKQLFMPKNPVEEGSAIYQDVYMKFDFMSGGRFPLASNDPMVLKAAMWAAGQLKGSLKSVTEAQGQIVQGELIYLTIQVQSASELKSCTVVVWERPWLRKNGMKLTKAVCKII